MSPSRNVHPHPLGGVRLVVLYVGVITAIAVLATILQQAAA